METLKVTTHSDGGKDYLEKLFAYLGDDRMVHGKPYGVPSKDPTAIADLFWLVAKFFGNADKNLVIHYIISFSRDTAPDEWTAFRRTTIYSWIKNKTIPVVRFPHCRNVYISVEALREMIRENTITSDNGGWL